MEKIPSDRSFVIEVALSVVLYGGDILSQILSEIFELFDVSLEDSDHEP